MPSLLKSAAQQVEAGTPPQHYTYQEAVWVPLLWQGKLTLVQIQTQCAILLVLSQFNKDI